ncbi:MAG: hypothetical protein IT438_06510 [Phycisphaerales bacterium]|nr:hypothetical protein [Phycisphaerales bacterium]
MLCQVQEDFSKLPRLQVSLQPLGAESPGVGRPAKEGVSLIVVRGQHV